MSLRASQGWTLVPSRGSMFAWMGIAALLLAGPAFSHHSAAMYDDQKILALTGTIKSFHWTNPHCWMELSTAGSHGEELWRIEMGPPTPPFSEDFKVKAFKPGETIVARIHPHRDGTRRGLWLSGNTADGRPLSLDSAER